MVRLTAPTSRRPSPSLCLIVLDLLHFSPFQSLFVSQQPPGPTSDPRVDSFLKASSASCWAFLAIRSKSVSSALDPPPRSTRDPRRWRPKRFRYPWGRYKLKHQAPNQIQRKRLCVLVLHHGQGVDQAPLLNVDHLTRITSGKLLLALSILIRT